MTLRKAYFNIIDDLIRLCVLNRDKAVEQELHHLLPPHWFAIEYCTVRCSIGRRVGNTTYIKETVRKNDLIVVETQRQAQKYKSIEAEVVTLAQLRVDGYLNYPAMIFVDDAGHLLRKCDTQDLYMMLCREYRGQIFVLLGV